MKKLIVLTAASGLMLSSALAQTTTAPGSNAPPPPSAAQSMPGDRTNVTGVPQATGQDFVAAQTADQWLATKFKGTNVIAADDQKVGSVSDILFARDGKVLAYVVSVGGFLGMGSKDVALAPSSFQVQPGQDATDFKLKIAMTQQQLKDAAAFEPYKAPAPTTGAAGPATPRPMGTPTRPTGSVQ